MRDHRGTDWIELAVAMAAEHISIARQRGRICTAPQGSGWKIKMDSGFRAARGPGMTAVWGFARAFAESSRRAGSGCVRDALGFGSKDTGSWIPAFAGMTS
jgi:hypothetical protein